MLCGATSNVCATDACCASVAELDVFQLRAALDDVVQRVRTTLLHEGLASIDSADALVFNTVSMMPVLKAINAELFGNMSLRGNLENYYDPENRWRVRFPGALDHSTPPGCARPSSAWASGFLSDLLVLHALPVVVSLECVSMWRVRLCLCVWQLPRCGAVPEAGAAHFSVSGLCCCLPRVARARGVDRHGKSASRVRLCTAECACA